MIDRSLFDEEDDDDFYEHRPSETERCTPERLLDLINETKRQHGRYPTLQECRARFGGILGPMVVFWGLRDEGRA